MIRPLQPEDERGGFESGEPDLDRFFRKYAGQNQYRHHIGTTYVSAGPDGMIEGFVTVSAGSVEIDDLPAASQKALPRYPLPVLRVARLAVHKTLQGRGIGSLLMKFALGLAARMAGGLGCVGVVVDAKPDSVQFYHNLGFESVHPVEGQSGHRPFPTMMFLSIGEILAAEGRKQPESRP